MKKPIYLDYHATTPCDQRVVDAMLPYFAGEFGNAASRQHAYGWTAEAAVNRARMIIARAIGGEPASIVFTSGATESSNLALKGICENVHESRNEIITSRAEHSSVLDVCSALEKKGFITSFAPVDETGLVDVAALEKMISPKTVVVSIMAANNEIGTIAPLKEIGAVCRKAGVLFHVDASQAFGKIPIDVNEMSIDLMSVSAHKMYGPKGIGALFVKTSMRRSQLHPQMHGGGHESGLRAGTLNVPGIVGFGKAVEIAMAERETESLRISALRDRLQQELTQIDCAFVNGNKSHRLPGNLNIGFDRVIAASLLAVVKNEIAISTGSACSSPDAAAGLASHVLQAVGLSKQAALSCIRVSIGRYTTQDDISTASRCLHSAVETLRRQSSQGISFSSPLITKISQPV